MEENFQCKKAYFYHIQIIHIVSYKNNCYISNYYFLGEFYDYPVKNETCKQPDNIYSPTKYMPGFGNDFETEALPGALPQGRNSPQKCNYGLYGEQLSGTAFTAPNHQNERTWCYRIRPSVKHSHRYTKIDVPHWKSAPNIVDDM